MKNNVSLWSDTVIKNIQEAVEEDNLDKLLVAGDTRLLLDAAERAAKLNKPGIVNGLLKRYEKQPDNYKLIVNLALKGYAAAGNFERVKEMIGLGAEPTHAFNVLTQNDKIHEQWRELLACISTEKQRALLIDNLEIYGIDAADPSERPSGP
ncbi:hypothetical protein ACFORL_01795 [Legionella dresdenensis]|uniref:Ankyrin repeat protein n=1 Tax=Legionella dresdenensis TaxID=450200 RepID=A0ABV8CCB2_9GAMM